MIRHQLAISNARIVDADDLYTIGIDDGHIATISPSVSELSAETTIDADGQLVTPSFVNGHMHLCKPYTFDDTNSEALSAYASGDMGGAMTSIELASKVKVRYTEETVYERARRAAYEGIRHGVLTVQAFADTDTAAGMHGVNGVMRVRDELREILDIRVVAFPQDGVVKDPGSAALVQGALEGGADVVGGIPWIELTDEEARDHVTQMLDLAVRHDRRVAMLVDDSGDPSLRTLEVLAVEAERRGLQGRVTACHARAAGTYPPATFERLCDLLNRAKIGVVSDPHTGPLNVRPLDLYDAGVSVGLGQDDIEDAYYPLGRHNLLEVAFLAAHLLEATSPQRLRDLFDMITVRGAQALGIHDHDLAVGNQANLVVLQGSTIRQVLIHHAPPRFVIRHGKVIAENNTTSVIHGSHEGI